MGDTHKWSLESIEHDDNPFGFGDFQTEPWCESKIGYGSLRGDPYYGSGVLT